MIGPKSQEISLRAPGFKLRLLTGGLRNVEMLCYLQLTIDSSQVESPPTSEHYTKTNPPAFGRKVEKGFFQKTIAAMAGFCAKTVGTILTKETISLSIHRKVAELFEQISGDALLVVPPTQRVNRRGLACELIRELVEEGFTKTLLAEMAGLSRAAIKRLFSFATIVVDSHPN